MYYFSLSFTSLQPSFDRCHSLPSYHTSICEFLAINQSCLKTKRPYNMLTEVALGEMGIKKLRILF